jgi:hypothetical protein
MSVKTVIAVACVGLCLTASAAIAADSTMTDIGNAAKDAAVQAGKDKAQQKMDGMSGSSSMGGMNMNGMSSGATGTMPTTQGMKDAAKDKAKEKASDAAGAAIDKALAK